MKKGEITYTMIKPDAINNAGNIIQMIMDANYHIEAMDMTKIDKFKAQKFYAEHKDKPFFNNLVSYMTSGNIIKMVLRKENAVEDFRKLIGSTNPKEAEPNTIRALYGTNLDANAIHGSDSDENALKEIILMFGAGLNITEINQMYD